MKTYSTYRSIRQRALIYGLPLPLFAIMMLSVTGGLLAIIFSFGAVAIFAAIIGNLVLYFLMLKINQQPQMFHFRKVFPTVITNKKYSGCCYES